MRDPRFVAAHRGGPLDRGSHVQLARWAAGCAERVLPIFTRCSADVRPAQALAIARAWANGEVRTGVGMKASVAAHAAARGVGDPAAIAAARAAAQAVATAHFADHCMGGLLYALKALNVAGLPWTSELEARLAELPANLRGVVFDGVRWRARGFGLANLSGPPS